MRIVCLCASKQNMGTQNCDTRKSMEDIKLYSPSAKSTKTIFVDNASASKKEIVANQTTLHSTQLLRNVPNILRNNIKTHRSNKTLTSDKSDISFASSIEDINSSLEQTTTLSSNESEKETVCNKIMSSKSYHQRKQVHNPIDIQYDVPDWNNKNDKNILQDFDQLNTPHVLQSYKKNVPKKKLKHNKRKKSLLNKKSKETTICKSNSSMEMLYEKLDFDTGSTTSPDINIKNTVEQTATFSANVFTESTSESDTAKYINNLNNIELQTDELHNVSYDQICNFEQCDINCNSVIPSKSTEFNTLQPEPFQEDVTNFKILMTEKDLKEGLINRDIPSDFLFDSKVLYTCTCVNCTACDKDVIFCEDPASSFTNSDTDTEFFTSYIYDPFIHDYNQIGDNILDDTWLKEFDKKNFYYEEVEETDITEETACIDRNNVIKLIESNTSVSSVEQSNTQNSQTYNINKIKDICVESYSTEFVQPPNEPIQSLKSVENAKILDEADYTNLDNILVKEGKVISQNEVFIETTNSTDESVFNSKSQKENKKDLCVIQCTQCKRLFNKKYQFRKHFTRCDFYKEDFKCHICDKIYKHKSSFDQHLRKVHHLLCNPDQKFYTCNKCSKLYVRFRAFQRHLLLHDD